MMRILMVSDGAHPDSFGGSQSCFHLVSRYFVAQGHFVCHVTGTDNKSLPAKENIEGVDFRRYRISGGRSRWVSALSTIIAARDTVHRVLSEQKFDLILVHHVLSGYGLLSELKSNSLIPLVYYFHSAWSHEYLVRAAYEKRSKWILSKIVGLGIKKLQSRLLKGAVLRIVESNYMLRMALQVNKELSEMDIKKIHPGIDVNRFKPADNRIELRRQIGIPEHKMFIFTARRLVPRMGLDRLVASMKAVISQCPDALLWIAGDGPMDEVLRRDIQKSGLSAHVKLLGRVDPDYLLQCYQVADLFVLPTLDHEGFGMVTVEALACGTPVLGTDLGGTSEILGPFNKKLLMPSTEVGAMASKLIGWIQSPDILRKLRPLCRAYVLEKYDSEVWLKGLESEFISLVKQKV